MEARVSHRHSVPLMVDEILNYYRTSEISVYSSFCILKMIMDEMQIKEDTWRPEE